MTARYIYAASCRHRPPHRQSSQSRESGVAFLSSFGGELLPIVFPTEAAGLTTRESGKLSLHSLHDSGISHSLHSPSSVNAASLRLSPEMWSVGAEMREANFTLSCSLFIPGASVRAFTCEIRSMIAAI